MPTLGKTKVSPSLISTGSLFLGTSSYAVTASYAMNGGSGGSGGSTQTGSIANQTILYNVTTSQDNVISGLNLSSNKWGVTVVEEWNSGSVVLDNNYDSCSLLCHFDSLNFDGRFIDNSKNNLVITSSGNVIPSPSNYKFGGASAYFNGNGSYLTISTISSNLTNDFTIECWIYIEATNISYPVVVGADGPFYIRFGDSGFGYKLQFSINDSGVSSVYSTAYTQTSLVNQWVHLALTRTSSTVRFFINGVIQSLGTGANPSSYPVTSFVNSSTISSNNWYIGNSVYNGYIDELRITKDVARYTSSFTPQTFAFPNSATQIVTKYIGLVGGLNDSNVDYGVEKLSDSSLKIRKMTASGQPLSGSGTLSASVDRVYVNVLDYTNVMVTSSYALTASYVLGGIQTGSISNQTILYNVTTSQDNTITGLDLSGNKWDVSVIEEWNSASVPGDLYYNSSSLLLHFDGTNNSTTFIDNSPNNFTVTSTNGAKITSSISKFGGSSGFFDGTNDYLSLSSNTKFAISTTEDYTVECWVNFRTVQDCAFWQTTNNPSSADGPFWFGYATGKLLSSRHGSGLYEVSATWTPSTGIWYHVSVTRASGTVRLFVDGIVIATNVSTQNGISFTQSGGAVGLLTTPAYFNGYLDELRVTKGVARYTGSFVTQSIDFPNSTGSIQYATKYIGLVGGINDSNVDYGVEKLSDTSLKIRKMTASGQPLSGSGGLSASVDRVYVNVLNYKEVQTTAQSASYAVTSSYTITSVTSSFALSASYLIPTSNNTTKAIFGYGYTSANVSITNLVSNTGVVANDTTGVGTARRELAAAGYSTDKAIFGYGYTSAAVSIINLVSNTGVVATDTTGVGTTRMQLAAARYGGDKAIFGYGSDPSFLGLSMTNLVNNVGLVASDTTGVGTGRRLLAAAEYATDRAIFGYGYASGAALSMTNLVGNNGIVASDTTGVGTARYGPAATGYGGDKAIFGYGNTGAVVSTTNLVSNTGVVATNTTGVGTARVDLAAAGYGNDKAIFGYGYNGSAYVSMTNLVNNTGVVATDTTGVGTARQTLAAAGYSTT